MGEPLDHAARAQWPSSLVNAAVTGENGAGTADGSALDELARRLQTSQMETLRSAGPQYLLFECGGINCTLPLAQLREVLNDVPRAIPLPNSPEWLLGIFPNRTEMLALVDPLPALQGYLGKLGQLGQPDVTTDARAAALDTPPERSRDSVLVVGTGERSLGLLVDGYGDTTTVQDHELDSTPEAVATVGLPIVARYVAAMYRPSDAHRRYVVLDADHLLSDLISALQEADEVYG